MSDYLIVRGGTEESIAKALAAWKLNNTWVNNIEIQERWDLQELEINRVNAIGWVRGKHKQEMAGLVLMLGLADIRLIHVQYRKNGREEIDLIGWAKALLGKT